MSTSILGFGPSTQATNFSVSQVEGAQLPPGGPQPPPASVSAAVSDSRIATDTYTQSQAASTFLASVAVPTPDTNANSTAPVTTATPAVSSPAASATQPTTQAQNPSTAVVAQNTTAQTNSIEQFEQSEAPPPYTLATSVPNPDRTNSHALAPAEFSPFQIRQFSDLLKTIRSITSAVLPNFSYSA